MNHTTPFPAILAITTPQGIPIERLLDEMNELQRRCPEISQKLQRNFDKIQIQNFGDIYIKSKDGQFRIYAPKSIRKMLIDAYHQEYTHPGYKKTLNIIRRFFN